MEENKKVETESNEAVGTTSTTVQKSGTSGDNKENIIIGLKKQLEREKVKNAKLLEEGVVVPKGDTSSEEGDKPDWADSEKAYKKAQVVSNRKIATLEEELGKVNRESRISDVCSRLGCPKEIFEGVNTDQDIITKIIEWREDTKEESKEETETAAGKFEKGSGVQSAITVEKIQNMSSEEFAKYEKQLDDEARRKERSK